MLSLRSDPKLFELAQRVEYFAREKFQMTLPEMRFFILDPMEFAALLEKNVYPTSPINIWEGKKIANKKHRIETGQESALYYEVVQTGNPSYAYLNETNSALTQASVMAHVAGHCEFSELNVLHDSDQDRTEYVMHLVRKVDLGRRQMGERRYIDYWNACESALPFIAPNSQYNLENSIDKETTIVTGTVADETPATDRPPISLVDETLEALLKPGAEKPFVEMEKKRERHEALSRHGYSLRAPCQDILGFLREYAPTSQAERAILDYLYTAHMHQDFVIRTQIMNEGWAMYWEKKIMMELFAEDAVRGAIDYAKVFSGVCYPRPYYQRNPYHLGYHMWLHIEDLYREGKMSLDYHEETDLDTKQEWEKPKEPVDPQACMRHLVKSITDYEFLRRFLTVELVEKFHLNRLDQRTAQQLGVKNEDIIRADRRWIWLRPEPIKNEMLGFFAHFYRPRIYIIDTDYLDGGLLLMHRDDGRSLRADWIRPTLNNLKRIWKAPVYLLSQDKLYAARADGYKERTVKGITFEEAAERLSRQQRPFKVT